MACLGLACPSVAIGSMMAKSLCMRSVKIDKDVGVLLFGQCLAVFWCQLTKIAVKNSVFVQYLVTGNAVQVFLIKCYYSAFRVQRS